MGMSDPRSKDNRGKPAPLSRKVGEKEARKLRARRHKDRSIWFGLGMFGVIGWSIVIPTLIGLAIGLWIDRTWPSPFSFTLMLLLAGLIIGCLNAWRWIVFEGTLIEEEELDEEENKVE